MRNVFLINAIYLFVDVVVVTVVSCYLFKNIIDKQTKPDDDDSLRGSNSLTTTTIITQNTNQMR